MPESTGVVTFEDVLTWAAEQGAFTDPCGVVPGTGVAQALRRVAEISQRASSAPASMRTFDLDGQRIEAFIDHVLERDMPPSTKAETCLEQQLWTNLEHLLGAYGWSVENGFDTPLHPRTDINYMCQHEIGSTTPPSWALDYFDFSDEPHDRAHVVVEIEGDPQVHTFTARTPDGSPLTDEEVIRQTERFASKLGAGPDSSPSSDG